LDGVIIATPPESHRELALKAIYRGMPVLVEKPLALTWEDCSAIIDAAESEGVPLLVGHTHLFAARMEEVLSTPSKSIAITIGGDQRGHEYSALLDWGSHGVAMAIACMSFEPISERFIYYTDNTRSRHIAVRSTNSEAQISISNQPGLSLVTIEGEIYYAKPGGLSTPMARMLDVFCRLIDGSWDRRADYEFARNVYRVLLTESEHGRTSKAIANG
jgi:hypothetical protein